MSAASTPMLGPGKSSVVHYDSVSHAMVKQVPTLKDDFEMKDYKERHLYSCASWLFWICFLIMGVGVPFGLLMLQINDPSDVATGHVKGRLLVTDRAKLRMGLSYICFVPVACLAIPMFLPQVWNKSVVPYIIILFFGLRTAASISVHEKYMFFVMDLCDNIIAALMAFIWIRVWDYLDHVVREIVEGEAHLLELKPIAKMRSIMHSRGVTCTGNEEKDEIYTFNVEDNHRTFASVLYSRCWRMLYVGSQVYALVCFLVYVMVSRETGYLLSGGVFFYVSAMIFGGYRVGAQGCTLLKLFFHNPFYVGDLVTVGATSGFVEHISMSYIVIRDFGLKQTFIPLLSLDGCVVQNWSRRPTKPIVMNVTFSGRCDVKAVEALVEFAHKWIDSNPKVLQKGYKKCVIGSMEHGFDLQIIFSPEIGVDKKSLRHEFIVQLGIAAERLQVPLSTINATNLHFPEGRDHACFGVPNASSGEKKGESFPDLSDLLPKEAPTKETKPEKQGP